MGDRAYVYATGMPEQVNDDDPGLEGAYAPLLNSANAVAFPSTVSAGFVFYNVVTFATDVRTVADQNWPKSFLTVNAITFGLGIVAVMYATLIGA